jgi:hypothetical protein
MTLVFELADGSEARSLPIDILYFKPQMLPPMMYLENERN